MTVTLVVSLSYIFLAWSDVKGKGKPNSTAFHPFMLPNSIFLFSSLKCSL